MYSPRWPIVAALQHYFLIPTHKTTNDDEDGSISIGRTNLGTQIISTNDDAFWEVRDTERIRSNEDETVFLDCETQYLSKPK